MISNKNETSEMTAQQISQAQETTHAMRTTVHGMHDVKVINTHAVDDEIDINCCISNCSISFL